MRWRRLFIGCQSNHCWAGSCTERSTTGPVQDNDIIWYGCWRVCHGLRPTYIMQRMLTMRNTMRPQCHGQVGPQRPKSCCSTRFLFRIKNVLKLIKVHRRFKNFLGGCVIPWTYSKAQRQREVGTLGKVWQRTKRPFSELNAFGGFDIYELCVLIIFSIRHAGILVTCFKQMQRLILCSIFV